MLKHNVSFSGSETQVSWQGNHATDAVEFRQYLAGPVRNRLTDAARRSTFETDLRALATTDMASDTLKNLLASETDKEPWEVGEAMAECLLEEKPGVTWPWNMERDKRTPKASLPGADLVGFLATKDGVILVLGEVKTSGDTANPPNVMTGRSGMAHQLDTLASDIRVHRCLLEWLHSRCKNTDHWPKFQEAINLYLASKGRAIILFGILMRDTAPNEKDLSGRAEALSKKVGSPTTVELHAWYCPEAMSGWPSLTKGGAS